MNAAASRWKPWSLRELAEDLGSGRTTPEEALARSDARIAETEADVRAWVSRGEPPRARSGPLAGVPFGVKDIIDLEGYATRCGSVLRAEAPTATADALVVQAWRATGARPVGKTVTTEFAFFAPGPTANPADLAHTPGGSSSGSAAAVASGQVPLALGSQTAGSVTRPASFCGVASLVMSHGRLPLDGVVGLSPSLDSHGVYAATAADLSLAWSAFSGEPDLAVVDSHPPRMMLWTGASLGVGAAMSAAVAEAVGRACAAGAEVEEFSLDEALVVVTRAHSVVMAYEACRERAAEWAQADRLSEPLANLLRAGAATSDEAYQEAVSTVAETRARVAEAFADCDVVIGPAALGAAPRGLAATGDPVLSRGWQALGLPTACIPGLRDTRGLPLGVQLVGTALGEAGLLQSAAFVERALVQGAGR